VGGLSGAEFSVLSAGSSCHVTLLSEMMTSSALVSGNYGHTSVNV
jgi:hypothetical protein